MTCKMVSEMTYRPNVSSGTSNPTIPYRAYEIVLKIHLLQNVKSTLNRTVAEERRKYLGPKAWAGTGMVRGWPLPPRRSGCSTQENIWRNSCIFSFQVRKCAPRSTDYWGQSSM